jgi:hypothetical protein
VQCDPKTQKQNETLKLLLHAYIRTAVSLGYDDNHMRTMVTTGYRCAMARTSTVKNLPNS